jgi:hypothetical protein
MLANMKARLDSRMNSTATGRGGRGCGGAGGAGCGGGGCGLGGGGGQSGAVY